MSNELELLEQRKLTTTELSQSIVDFFSTPEVYEVEEHVYTRDGKDEINKRLERRPFPMIEDWCVDNRVPMTLLKKLEQSCADVALAVQFARDVMKTYLVRGGLERRYDPSFAIFVATNETGMRVKSEVTHKGKQSSRAILDEIEQDEDSLIEE